MKCEIFRPIVQKPKDVKPIGYKWVFVRKCNEHNKIIGYKARITSCTRSPAKIWY